MQLHARLWDDLYWLDDNTHTQITMSMFTSHDTQYTDTDT